MANFKMLIHNHNNNQLNNWSVEQGKPKEIVVRVLNFLNNQIL